MAFYQCPKCKRKWQYPIEKCPNCFLKLERVLPGMVRVIGVSKTTIPTMLHPKVPYFVLLLEDEKGNKWVQKSVKEYKIGERVNLLEKARGLARAAQNRKVVALWRIKYDDLEAIETVLYLIGMVKIGYDSKILILPTLDSPKHPYLSENTRPQFLESLIQYLLQRGAKTENIKVAGQSFNEFPIEISAQKSKILSVCQKYHIIPVDLAKGDFVKKEENGTIFEISEEAFNSDLIINLPIMKLDARLGVKGALQNVTKLLKKECYFSLQYLLGEEEMIEKLQGVLPSHLTIADGSKVKKATGFSAFLGIVLASFNSFNLDRVFSEIVMLKGLPGYLKKIKIKDVLITGREIEEVRYDFINL